MKIVFLAIACAIVYVASASTTEEVINFVGEDRELTCIGSEINWLRNNTVIPAAHPKLVINVGVLKSQPSSTLTIKKISPVDVADYRCYSHKSKDVDKTFSLKLYFPLTFRSFTKDRALITEGGDVTVKCNVIGVPTPTLKWFFDENELYDKINENIEVHPNELVLKKVRSKQAGEYTCMAIQEFGSVKYVQERKMDLEVEYGPKSHTPNETIIYTDPGNTETLVCSFVANPFVQFTWSRDGFGIYKDIDSFDNVSRLKIKIDEEEMKRKYVCTANNAYGQVSQEFSFKPSAEKPPASSSTFITSASLFTMALITLLVNVLY